MRRKLGGAGVGGRVGGRGLRGWQQPLFLVSEGKSFCNRPYLICNLRASFHCHLSAAPYFQLSRGKKKKKGKFSVAGSQDKFSLGGVKTPLCLPLEKEPPGPSF